MGHRRWRVHDRAADLVLHPWRRIYGRQRIGLPRTSSHLSAATGCRVLAVDYRWAPEEPFPAALDDCVAAYRWLVTAGGASPRNVVLAGDSAGGNLVVAMLLALKQTGDELPAAGVCLSAIFDLALTGDLSPRRAERDPMILASSLQKCSAAYRGNADPRDPLMSPLYGDLTGLPPLLLQCGSEEMLRDDSSGSPQRLRPRASMSHSRNGTKWCTSGIYSRIVSRMAVRRWRASGVCSEHIGSDYLHRAKDASGNPSYSVVSYPVLSRSLRSLIYGIVGFVQLGIRFHKIGDGSRKCLHHRQPADPRAS